MRRILFFLFASVTALCFAEKPSDFYAPDLRLDSIVNPFESKHVYGFDQWGYNTLRESYSWSTQRNDWMGTFKNVLAFDENGNETLYESYGWDSTIDDWVGTMKSEYVFDADNQMVQSTMYSPDPYSYGWVPSRRNLFEYDKAGNRTHYEYTCWSADDNDWVPEKLYIYAYNDLNEVILGEEWNWSTTLNEWVGSFKITKERSGVLFFMLSKQYAWDSSDSDWRLIAEEEGEWNDTHTCWTLTQYAVSGDEREPERSILYYFSSTSSLGAPAIIDNCTSPFGEPIPSPDDLQETLVFDISGRMVPANRLESLPNGIFIVNGKKVRK